MEAFRVVLEVKIVGFYIRQDHFMSAHLSVPDKRFMFLKTHPRQSQRWFEGTEKPNQSLFCLF